MTEQESFLSRWSRLKVERAREAEPAPPPALDAEEPAAKEPEPFDPASLPAVETLGADSDYTPFMNSGVPEALQSLALRRAWASDPVIAGFRGFADYDWDFNAPGYGDLLASDNVRELCDAVMRQVTKAEERPALEAPEVAGEAPPEAGEEVAAPQLPAAMPPLEVELAEGEPVAVDIAGEAGERA